MRKTLTAALIFTASGAAADPLDRLIVATEALSEKANAFYISRVPALDGKLPDMTVEGELRNALACALDMIVTEGGPEMQIAYVESMEEMASRDINNITDLQEVPDVVPDEILFAAMSECGMMEITAQRMKDSGFWEAMQDPDVMQALMAEE